MTQAHTVDDLVDKNEKKYFLDASMPYLTARKLYEKHYSPIVVAALMVFGTGATAYLGSKLIKHHKNYETKYEVYKDDIDWDI